MDGWFQVVSAASSWCQLWFQWFQVVPCFSKYAYCLHYLTINVMCSTIVLVVIIKSSHMKWTLSMCMNIGWRATLSSLWAGYAHCETFICVFIFAWNTVKYLEESSCSIYQKTDMKSIFKNSVQPASLDLISSCDGIGWLVGIIDLLMLFGSKVILSVPSALGFITIFETHGEGWFIGCSLVISCLIMSSITFGSWSWCWYSIDCGGVATGFAYVFMFSLFL